ncbi:hypothetical protein DFQ28_003689 [Apophysomyces sp. BC1034]|nr:hypothetical protein DFQ28_003689 [Apophysomyces sp. BC1034]
MPALRMNQVFGLTKVTGLLDDAKRKVKALESAERDGKKALRKTEEVIENRIRSEFADERSRRYVLQKRVDVLKKKKKKKKKTEEKEEVKMCKPESWNRPGCEARTQFLDIADLH